MNGMKRFMKDHEDLKRKLSVVATIIGTEIRALTGETFADIPSDPGEAAFALRDLIKKLQAENERLRSELAPFQPMSIEEAEKAYDEAESVPMSEEQIEHGLKYATDPEYRANHLQQRLDDQFHILRAFRKRIQDLEAAVSEEIFGDNPKRLLELERALEESVKLQSHYAGLLNQYDGGRRMQFKDADAWIKRLQELDAVEET